MKRHTYPILCLFLLIAFCSAAHAQDTAKPEPVEIAYGDHERQRLDLYIAPDADAERPSPVVLYFHGGGFINGDKSKVSPNLIKRMHDKGISVAAVNYRFIRTDPLPAAMHDGARAVQMLRHLADEHHLDAERFAMTGGSAGAGISLWVALHDDMAQPDSEDLVARQSTRITCAYPKNGQVSYDPRFWREIGLERVFERRTFHELYGYPDDAEPTAELTALFDEASPITHLSADAPPIRLDYGYGLELNADTPYSALIHHPKHGVAFKESCEKVGVECTLIYPGGPEETESGYAFLIRQLKK